MKNFIGNIFHGPCILTRDIVISIRETERGIKRSWHGSFFIPQGSGIETGPFQLGLNDGRCGRIQINELEVTPAGQWIAHFLGDSELTTPDQKISN